MEHDKSSATNIIVKMGDYKYSRKIINSGFDYNVSSNGYFISSINRFSVLKRIQKVHILNRNK